MRICVIAPGEFPISEPFAGGLESHLFYLIEELARRGHDVAVASCGTVDPNLGVRVVRAGGWQHLDWSWDLEMAFAREIMRDLAADVHGRFDVIHNGGLTTIPLEYAPLVQTPMVTALHTPPTERMQAALGRAGSRMAAVAVSRFASAQWGGPYAVRTIRNGVNTDRWTPGPGGSNAVWFGRLLPKKGAAEAIAAAESLSMPLVLSGPVHDAAWFRDVIAPQLGDLVTYAGHLDHGELNELIGHSGVTVVPPLWEEPFGLVAAESLACGTPVAAYDSGALGEFVIDRVGALAPMGDVVALAAAMAAARTRDRRHCRLHAEHHCSLRRMVDEYEDLYGSVMASS